MYPQNPSWKSSARGTGRVPCAHIPTSSATGGSWKPLGRGQEDRELEIAAVKGGAREGGAALRKKEEGMGEREPSVGIRAHHSEWC